MGTGFKRRHISFILSTFIWRTVHTELFAFWLRVFASFCLILIVIVVIIIIYLFIRKCTLYVCLQDKTKTRDLWRIPLMKYYGTLNRPFDRLQFCTLWPCDLDLWPFDLILIGGRGLMMDYPCGKFGDCRPSNHQTCRMDSPSWVLARRLILGQKVKGQGHRVTKCKIEVV